MPTLTIANCGLKKIWSQSKVSRTSVETFARSIENYTASSQTSYLRNCHLLTLALLMRHNRISEISSLQQQSCKFHAVAETIIDCIGMRNANTSTRFFYGLLRVKQIVHLLSPCCLILMKKEKVVDPKKIALTPRTPVDWHET